MNERTKMYFTVFGTAGAVAALGLIHFFTSTENLTATNWSEHWPILVTLSSALIFFIACVIGSFLGSSNPRCYSPESDQNQGRLRLDDCNNVGCHERGRCVYVDLHYFDKELGKRRNNS